ncbi:isopenicillin N synthetase [Gloeophyllum trabeum ATCC 11539]|uniref:Isopenicillin N synthetase n=1 Tax=Gloeophyllum trabeum (strain ATCC 11539 / FP-39264 / Madison 617) TaxID=670483 RepID=S7Q311_GLOTA|nr:isopenicillin N synthetase [Gloeophyllum trabeum ATCC 11539]EPQ53888.1 isopenicillin N synthetase [Gloeophyllum trabeum ATCC 11539]
MSQTSTIESNATVSTLQLQNGQIVSYKSNVAKDTGEIPIIDISGIFSKDIEDRKAVAEQVREAASRIGFFYAVNHGIEGRYKEDTFEQARRFFALPMEEKMSVWTGLVPNEYYNGLCACGRLPESRNRTDRALDLSEAFNWAYDAQYDPAAVDKERPSISIWPDGLPGFKETLYAYHTQLLMLARKMTRMFALALRMPEDYFDEYVKRPEAAMRILHYPEQEQPLSLQAPAEEQNGIGAHTDFECFTMVTQDDCGGLEVLSRSGDWVKAPPVPGALVVNIADCFMRQTNDFFVSTVHRVINKSGKERYSCPFFFGFDVPSCVSKENPMKYPVMTSGEYYKFRVDRAKSSGLGN